MTETTGVRAYITNAVRPGTGAQVTVFATFVNSPEYSDVLRIACHQAIEMLTNEGVEELSVSLGEILEFYDYDNTMAKNTALPFLKSQPALKGSTYERVPFHIDED